jgi:hypothetical protein
MPTRADIAFVYETKSLCQKSVQFLQMLLLRNFDVVPANGLFGGLWLIWGSHITMRIFEKTKYYCLHGWRQHKSQPGC